MYIFAGMIHVILRPEERHVETARRIAVCVRRSAGTENVRFLKIAVVVRPIAFARTVRFVRLREFAVRRISVSPANAGPEMMAAGEH